MEEVAYVNHGSYKEQSSISIHNYLATTHPLAILSWLLSLSDSLVDMVAFETIRLFWRADSPSSMLACLPFLPRPRGSYARDRKTAKLCTTINFWDTETFLCINHKTQIIPCNTVCTTHFHIRCMTYTVIQLQ
jgi:hypothetical protein